LTKIPGKTSRKIYEHKWIVETVSVVPPVIAAGYAAYAANANPNTAASVPWLLFGIVWLILASIVKILQAFQQDKEFAMRNTHEGLAGASRVLHASVLKQANLPQKSGELRVTVHRVVPPLESPKHYEQLIPYIGGNGGEAFRLFPIHTGITGRVAREQGALVYSRQNDDYDAYLKELVAHWGYTEAEARKLQQDRKAWMAVPIFSAEQVVLAVVYLDSSTKDVFTSEIKQLVIDSCGGFAAHITERYKS
jgi:hypothetical protein